MGKVNEIGDKWDDLAMQTERKLCVLKDVRTLHQFNCICQDMVSLDHSITVYLQVIQHRWLSLPLVATAG